MARRRSRSPGRFWKACPHAFGPNRDFGGPMRPSDTKGNGTTGPHASGSARSVHSDEDLGPEDLSGPPPHTGRNNQSETPFGQRPPAGSAFCATSPTRGQLPLDIIDEEYCPWTSYYALRGRATGRISTLNDHCVLPNAPNYNFFQIKYGAAYVLNRSLLLLRYMCA